MPQTEYAIQLEHVTQKLLGPGHCKTMMSP